MNKREMKRAKKFSSRKRILKEMAKMGRMLFV